MLIYSNYAVVLLTISVYMQLFLPRKIKPTTGHN